MKNMVTITCVVLPSLSLGRSVSIFRVWTGILWQRLDYKDEWGKPLYYVWHNRFCSMLENLMGRTHQSEWRNHESCTQHETVTPGKMKTYNEEVKHKEMIGQMLARVHQHGHKPQECWNLERTAFRKAWPESLPSCSQYCPSSPSAQLCSTDHNV